MGELAHKVPKINYGHGYTAVHVNGLVYRLECLCDF
jgi:hypothetical protein